jgi:predicted membrane-bound mannosyltransferase
MLMMNVMKVLLYTFSAICKNFQKFFARTVETLKKIIAYLIKSFMKPMQLIFIAILNSFFTLKFTQNGQNLLTEAIVALNEHSAKHIVRSSIQGKEVLFIFTVKLSINILSAIGIETLKS